MPELPEVQTVVSTLRPRVTGSRIATVRLHRTDIVNPAGVDLPPLLRGRTITAVERRAKRIVFTLDDRDLFYVHLGMTGQLTVEHADAPVRPHTHLVMALEKRGSRSEKREGLELRFRDPRRFGGVFWLGSQSPDDGLGPEPLSLRPGRLANALARTRRAIKAALLDQALIAGIGNIYADEALFLARIHPLTAANTLSPEQVGRLNRAIKLTLRRAIRARGSTLRDFVDADNAPGGYRSRHQVYDRAGETCRRCRTVIERIVLTGRSTCFCPRCQPA
ncbi:MAG TPA: bifunctional DNA-formamidopyrimidine glycosylase/DNA-(apurinic or apyrimidinic site) lyase [Tepidisphaeraceae bacterium]|jgi:formamidopyrimidine-DNA glycosylase